MKPQVDGNDYGKGDKPSRVGIEVENIPKELIEKPRWVCWRWVLKDEKWTKPPYNPENGKLASSTDSSTWTSFDKAYSKYRAGSWDGIGFILNKEYTGVDFDDSRDPFTGQILEPSLSEIKRLNSYTEISPSFKGFKSLTKATLPKGGHHGEKIGVFDNGRYFCITGNAIEGVSKQIESRQEEINNLVRKLWPEDFEEEVKEQSNGNTGLSDLDLIEKIKASAQGEKFKKLWAGDWSDYLSQSEADLALCSIFAFWTGRNPEGIDRLFRQSGLYRKKWDRHDYSSSRTIQKAISLTTETYHGSREDSKEPGVETVSEEGVEARTEGPIRRESSSWPNPLAEEVFHGLAGDFVHLLEPHTESDPAALLSQFLSVVGNVIGPSAFFQVEADRHYLKIYPVLVGETSKGRKGTSFGYEKNIISRIDPDWASKRIMSGLSSGEGLLWQVRDEVRKKEAIREKGRVTGEYQDVVVDQGESDKRLFVIEQEFASTLRVIGRDGNTLSPTIRQAWDSGDLRILTKNSPVTATGAHISVIGHITRDELRRYLDRTEMGNGFANRFLWVCVRRSKSLPDGGRANEVNFDQITRRLTKAIKFAKEAGELKKDENARGLWADVYTDLSAGKPGLLGSVTSRAESQVMRISCLYALLDESSQIKVEHLLAALALWDYCEQSAKYIFGDATGDVVADRSLEALRGSSTGLTRTEIRDLFFRHVGQGSIGFALSSLEGLNLIRMVKEVTSGRPTERWMAT